MSSSVIVVILLGAVVHGIVLSLAILIVIVRVALLVIVDIFLLLLLLILVIVLLLLIVVAVVLLLVVVVSLLLLLLLVLILILLLFLIVTSLIVPSLLLLLLLLSVVFVFLLYLGIHFRRKYFACGLLIYASHGFSMHEHLVEAFFLFCRLLLLGSSCVVSRQVSKLIVLVSSSLLLRRWLIVLHFLVRIVIVHFRGQATHLVFGLLSRADNDRRDVLHPAVPVAVNKLGHVVRLRIRILQVEICRLSRALVRVPIGGDSPGISAGI